MATAQLFIDNWIPRCYQQGTPCSAGFQFHHTMPAASGIQYNIEEMAISRHGYTINKILS